jgi:DNA-binding response OmpR family regulator
MFTLLFIEDDEAIRTALQLVLEDEGYEVAVAGDGETGIKMFGQIDPDLVLLDLRLPDISGFEVCRAIRRTSITPVIMVTAQTDTSDLVNGFDAGADDYVTKPVVPKELAARIRAALRRTQSNEPSSSNAKSLNRIGDVEIDRSMSIVRKPNTAYWWNSQIILGWCCHVTNCLNACGAMNIWAIRVWLTLTFADFA